jgi:dihydrofolate reductase
MNVVVCSSLETAVQRLQEPPLVETIESAWVIGGSSVYKVGACYFELRDAMAKHEKEHQNM